MSENKENIAHTNLVDIIAKSDVNNKVNKFKVRNLPRHICDINMNFGKMVSLQDADEARRLALKHVIDETMIADQTTETTEEQRDAELADVFNKMSIREDKSIACIIQEYKNEMAWNVKMIYDRFGLRIDMKQIWRLLAHDDKWGCSVTIGSGQDSFKFIPNPHIDPELLIQFRPFEWEEYCVWSFVTHIGDHSIETTGITPTDIGAMTSINYDDYSNTLVMSLLPKMQSNIDNVEYVEDLNAYKIHSSVTLPRSTFGTGGQSYTWNGYYSRFLPEATPIMEQVYKWRRPQSTGTFEPKDTERLFRSAIALNMHGLEPLLNETLNPNANNRAVLKQLSNRIATSGQRQYDNVGLYFKLWCNMLARHRLSVADMAPLLPEAVNAANSGFNPINMGEDQTLLTLTDLAVQQFFAFFQSIDIGEDYITICQILGHEGMFFRSPADDDVAPWNALKLPRINVCYFHNGAAVDRVRDITAQTLRDLIIVIANERNERVSCLRGFTYACEIMIGDAYRHVRHSPAVRKTNYEPWAPPARSSKRAPAPAFAAYRNPGKMDFVGDWHSDKFVPQYDTTAWDHLMTDCYFQHKFTGLPEPKGENWLFRMMLIKKPAEPHEIFIDSMGNCTIMELYGTAVMLYAIIQSAATTVFQAGSISGEMMDNWQLGVVRDFSSFTINDLFKCESVDANQQATFFGMVSNVISMMTKYDYACGGYRREYNNGDVYPTNAVDHNGLYYWLTGYYPIGWNPVMNIDCLISTRPREWGITAPYPVANLSSCWEPKGILGHASWTFLGDKGCDISMRRCDDFMFLFANSFELLAINIICSANLRANPGQFATRYQKTPHNVDVIAPTWTIDDAIVHPPPRQFEDIGYLDVSTHIHFDWINLNHLRFEFWSPVRDNAFESAYYRSETQPWDCGIYQINATAPVKAAYTRKRNRGPNPLRDTNAKRRCYPMEYTTATEGDVNMQDEIGRKDKGKSGTTIINEPDTVVCMGSSNTNTMQTVVADVRIGKFNI